MHELAQKLIISTAPGETPFEIQGPLPTLLGGGYEFTNLASVVTAALPLVFSIAGIFLLAYLVWGGFDFLTSMGDPKKAEAGKNKITSALIGILIIISAYWIVQLVDKLFQLKIYNP